MLANLPVEIILLICEYPEFKDLGQLARTNKRMMQIVKRYLPIALVLERKTLFYLFYENNYVSEGKIGLFDSHTNSVEQIAKFSTCLSSYQVATTKDKIFALDSKKELFEIFDLNIRQITRGPDPPEWRNGASVAYFKNKLYYVGGYRNRVDILIDGEWQTGPTFPLPTGESRTITCDEILYVIDGISSQKIYRLSDDEREWIEIGEIPERLDYFGVASLNGKIYITGGWNYPNSVFKSCLCFEPSAPVDNRISRIADMNYARKGHSLIVANGKLYAIGGVQKTFISWENFCNSIEEYDPQTNEWREIGEINSHKILFYLCYGNNNSKYEGRICLFNPFICSVGEIEKFHNCYRPYKVATTQNKIFATNTKERFEIYDLNTRQISRGPDSPEWRDYKSVAYFKEKLYYLGGWNPNTNRVDVLIDGKWQIGPDLPRQIHHAQTIACDQILYVIGGWNSNKIYRLSDDELEWIEIGEIPEKRIFFGVISLNGRIYIIGGQKEGRASKSCLYFDPSAPVDSRISRIADMNCERLDHSLIVANGKLYAIGGFQKLGCKNLCGSIEEYDPQTDNWRVVGRVIK